MTEQKARTVAVVASYPRSLLNFRAELLEAMVRRGHTVFACAPDIDQDIRSALADIGVESVPIVLDRKGLNPFGDLRTLISLTRCFRDIRPDVVLGYTIKPVIYGSLAGALAGVPFISSMITGLGSVFSRTSLRGRMMAALARTMYRLALKRNFCVLFQNPDDLAVFASHGIIGSRNRNRLINGSGVNLDRFRTAPIPEQVSFLLIARLIGEKGVREYAAAAEHLKQTHQSVSFRLAGWIDHGPGAIAESELKSWTDQGLIEYLGRLEDVRPAIADCSVYVLPSFYGEGTPRSVLEAMAMGRPIITTDAPGCRETVETGRNGFLVSPRNVPDLAAAMERFIQEPGLAIEMGRESRNIAEEKFDVHKVNAVILDALGL